MRTIKSLFSKPESFFDRYALFLILIFALFIRFIGLDSGLPYLYNLRDYEIVNPAINILVTGDLNTHHFIWPGSFATYLLTILFGIILAVYFTYCLLFGYVHNLTEFRQLIRSNPVFYYDINPILFHFIGRLLMVFFALVTIYLVYLVAKRLFNKQAGLLAAFCLSISPLHIEQSRVMRPDITAAMLVMFSMYFLLRFIDESKNTKWLILSSLFAGFSIAAKYTAGVIIFPILIHCLTTDSKELGLFTSRYFINFLKIKTNLSKALVFIFIGFFIFAPFVILDFKHAIRGIMFVAASPKDPYLRRLPGIQNHIWYLKDALRSSIGGLFFEIFAGLGVCLILYKKLYKEYLFLVFPILSYLIIGCGNLRRPHWIMPVYPFEAILFGVGLYGSYRFIIQRNLFKAHRLKISLLFIIALIFASYRPVIRDIKRGIELTKPDTRTIAKEWIENNLPSGSKIAYEGYIVTLHVKPRGDFTLIFIADPHSGVLSQPLPYYKNQSVDYIIISCFLQKDLAKMAAKYRVTFPQRYQELKNGAQLTKCFMRDKESQGPRIEIYKLK